MTTTFFPVRPYRVYLNDGQGQFTEKTAEMFPLGLVGKGTDVEAVDFNRDSQIDLYLCGYSGADRLLLGHNPITAVEAEKEKYPFIYSLGQNYPNPFNATTRIEYEIVSSYIDLAIYNLAGQRVATLVSGKYQAGTYTIQWSGGNDDGHELASGVYLYRLRVGDGQQVETRKLLLLR